MQITSYQMRNVLACYGKKLSRTRMPAFQPGMTAEQLAISPETTRRATMDKISRQLLEKIADVVALQPTHEGSQEPALNAGIDPGVSTQSGLAESSSFSLADPGPTALTPDSTAMRAGAWIGGSERPQKGRHLSKPILGSKEAVSVVG